MLVFQRLLDLAFLRASLSRRSCAFFLLSLFSTEGFLKVLNFFDSLSSWGIPFFFTSLENLLSSDPTSSPGLAFTSSRQGFGWDLLLLFIILLFAICELFPSIPHYTS